MRHLFNRNLLDCAKFVAIAALVLHAELGSATEGIIQEITESLDSLTIEKLISYYGTRVKVNRFLCALPPEAELRNPLDLDCRVWSVGNVSAFAGLIQAKEINYRAMQGGRVQERQYISSGDCGRVLGDYLLIHGMYFKEVNPKVSGAPLSVTNIVGSLSAFKNFSKGKANAWLSLDYENNACEMQYVVKMAR